MSYYHNRYPSYMERENTNFNIDIDTPEELKVWQQTQKWKQTKFYIGLGITFFIIFIMILIAIFFPNSVNETSGGNTNPY